MQMAWLKAASSRQQQAAASPRAEALLRTCVQLYVQLY
jgi:hypothetical protein